jgi:hypothetical protein
MFALAAHPRREALELGLAKLWVERGQIASNWRDSSQHLADRAREARPGKRANEAGRRIERDRIAAHADRGARLTGTKRIESFGSSRIDRLTLAQYYQYVFVRESQGSFRGAHRVAKAQRQLNPAIEALVRERLEGDEIILGWNEFKPGWITVRLIPEKLHRVCAPIAEKFGRGAGCGRSLIFKRHYGRWEFHGVGGWIS